MSTELEIPAPRRPMDRLWPSDRLFLPALAVSIVLLVGVRDRSPQADFWVVVDLLLIGLQLVVTSTTKSLAQGARWRMILPLVTIPLIFTQLGATIPYVNPRGYEAELNRLDRFLAFGRDPLRLVAGLAHPLLTEILQWIYDFYFFITLIVGVAIYRKGRSVELARTAFVFSLCILLSYVGYYLVPATGPNIDRLGLYGFESGMPGVFLADELRATIYVIEKIKQDCFPSGHVAVSVTALLLAGRYCRETLILLWPLVAALVFSTVYLRYHYVTDVLGGILLAWMSTVLGLAWHRRFERRIWGWHGQSSRDH